MLKRIALVIWWIGTLWIGGGVVAFFGNLFSTASDRAATAVLTLAVCAIVGVCFWTVTFILGGTFRRPPKLN